MGHDDTAMVKSPAAFTREQIDLVRRTIAKKADDDELALFLYQAKRLGLDPLSRQIHFVKRWDSDLGREVGVAQTGIDGFRLIASRTGRYRPDDEPPRFTYDSDGTLLSATVKVWTYHQETKAWYPVPATAYYREYVQTRKDGTPMRMWAKMPHVMLQKVAESLSIRKAFPSELSGIYAFEEFGHTEEEVSRGENGGEREPAPPVVVPSTGEVVAHPATMEQRKLMHVIWKTRHKLAEADFKRWLNHHFHTIETKTLAFDQAKGIITQLQNVDTTVLTDELRSIPLLPEQLGAPAVEQTAL